MPSLTESKSADAKLVGASELRTLSTNELQGPNMNRRTTLPLWLACLLLTLMVGCTSNRSAPLTGEEKKAAQDVGNQEGLAAQTQAIPESISVLGRVPDFRLVDQDGEEFGLTDLADKTWIANFIFTRCTATCPEQTAKLRQLQRKLQSDSQLTDIHLVSISVDNQHDVPSVLKEYATQAGADESTWSFLTGSREQTWELSKTGFKLAVGDAPENEAMPLFHSPKFILVDRNGLIRGYYESSDDAEVAKLESDLQVVVNEPRKETPLPTDDQEEIDVEGGAFLPSDLQASDNSSSDEVRRVYSPSQKLTDPSWLAERAANQRKDVEQRLDAFYGFQFEDKFPTSGITFTNEVVEDAGKAYKAAHYDHGNGIAIADVDGDGRHDLYFTTQLGGNALYRNLGNGKFADITATAGVALSDKISVTSSFADMDNDGDPDLFVTTVRGGNFLFENLGGGKYQDVTAEAGLTYENGHSASIVVFDYDKDGLLDLFVANVGKFTTEEIGPGNYYIARSDAFAGHLKPELAEKSKLYRNRGGLRFEDVTAQAGLDDDSWSGDATPMDANEDGWPDLYVLDMQGHDEYFENINGKRFEKRSREVFPKTPWGSMGVKVFDFDRDGRQDLFVTDMHSDMSEKVGIDREKLKSNMQFPESMLRSGGMSIFGNAFFRRDGKDGFVEISDRIGAENYWPWGFSVGDLNADGWDDVFIASSMNLQFRYGVNTVLLNNHGREFVDSEFVVGVEPRRDNVTSKYWYTLDADGADAGHSFLEKLGITSGKVEVWGAMGTRSSVIFDLDGDGDLDIVTNECHSVPLVLISNLSDKDDIQFLKVKLVGKKSNRDGLGASVRVT